MGSGLVDEGLIEIDDQNRFGNSDRNLVCKYLVLNLSVADEFCQSSPALEVLGLESLEHTFWFNSFQSEIDVSIDQKLDLIYPDWYCDEANRNSCPTAIEVLLCFMVVRPTAITQDISWPTHNDTVFLEKKFLGEDKTRWFISRMVVLKRNRHILASFCFGWSNLQALRHLARCFPPTQNCSSMLQPSYDKHPAPVVLARILRDWTRAYATGRLSERAGSVSLRRDETGQCPYHGVGDLLAWSYSKICDFVSYVGQWWDIVQRHVCGPRNDCGACWICQNRGLLCPNPKTKNRSWSCVDWHMLDR